LALGQVEVAEKENEIIAFSELLEVLDISGCIVTIDTMGCQTDIAEKIVEEGGDYVLALKKNGGHLYEDVKLLFWDLEQNPIADAYIDCDVDSVETVEKDHGWIETCFALGISGTDCITSLRNTNDFANLKIFVKVTSPRDINDVVSVKSRYYISSLDCDMSQLLDAA
jgi:hypothetical protein